nr:hypothetical protein [Paenibacillus sp. UNC499MF]
MLDPLGMKDAGFYVPNGKLDRLRTAYIPIPLDSLRVVDAIERSIKEGREVSL